MARYHWRAFMANLEPVVGSEQGRTRPVIVISEEDISCSMPIVTAVPLTSHKPGRRVFPNEVLLAANEKFPRQDSLVLTHRIRALDKKRLLADLGTIDSHETREAIITALMFHLGRRR